MTIVFSVQHSRSGSGATTVALALAYNLSLRGRTLYIEADFLNPMIENLTMSRDVIRRWSNEWITGEAKLSEACKDTGAMFNLPSNRLYLMFANTLEDARRRMEILDVQGDKNIFETLEKEKWVVNGQQLDYVVIDTPPWMHYTLSCISYISNYVFYVIKPNMHDLIVLKDRIENIYSNFICLVNPIINMFELDNEGMKKFEKEFIERIGVKPLKIPYISELASGIDLLKISDRRSEIHKYLVKLIEEIVKKPEITESNLSKRAPTIF